MVFGMCPLDLSEEFRNFKHFKFSDVGSPGFLECARDCGAVFSIYYDGDIHWCYFWRKNNEYRLRITAYGYDIEYYIASCMLSEFIDRPEQFLYKFLWVLRKSRLNRNNDNE